MALVISILKLICTVSCCYIYEKNIHICCYTYQKKYTYYPDHTPTKKKKIKIKDFGGYGTLLYIFPRETQCFIHPVTTIAANM